MLYVALSEVGNQMVSYLKPVFYTKLMVTYFLVMQFQGNRSEEKGHGATKGEQILKKCFTELAPS